MRVRDRLSAGAEAVPADVEAVGVVAAFQQWTHLTQERERRRDLVRVEVEHRLPVRLRHDHAAPAQRLAVLEVPERRELVLGEDDALAAQTLEVAEEAGPGHAATPTDERICSRSVTYSRSPNDVVSTPIVLRGNVSR